MKTLTRKKFIIVILAVVMAFSLLMFSAIGEVHADETQEIITPVEIVNADFALVEGAAVRVLDVEDKYNNGLRFASTLSATDYKGIMANEKYSDIEFGVFIMPYDYIAEYGDLTEENLFGSQEKQAVYDWAIWSNGGWVYNGTKTRIINIYSTEMTEMLDGNYYLNASITGLLEENIARDFVSAGYIKYTENGVVKYEMADYVDDTQRSNVRSMAYVAQKAIAYTGVDACDDDQKKCLADNYIAKSVVDNTAKDFGYVDKSATSENYTFNLPENVTALRVTMNDAEYSEVPFTCENGVISIDKAVVEGGISAGVLANGENYFYIHTVDTNGEKPVYSVNKVCIFIADVVLTQADANNLKTIIEANADKYIVMAEDIKDVVLNQSICAATKSGSVYVNAFTGTFDGRGHSITMKLGTGVYAFINNVIGGTVQNLYADIDRTTSDKLSTNYVGGLVGALGKTDATAVGNVNNCFVKYKFYERTITGEADCNYGAVVGWVNKGTVNNCMAELVWASNNSKCTAGAIVGGTGYGAADTIKDCYSVINRDTAYYYSTAKYMGYTVVRYVSSSGIWSPQNPKDCGIYQTYEELFVTGSTVKDGSRDNVLTNSWSAKSGNQLQLSQAKAITTLPANKGWSEYWSLENVDGDVLVKFGDVVIYNSAN